MQYASGLALVLALLALAPAAHAQQNEALYCDYQCEDGLDNDGDGYADYPADPGCDSGMDDDETDAGRRPRCSDGADNDADGWIDAADPACHTDHDPHNPATYDPGYDNEADDYSRMELPQTGFPGSPATPVGSYLRAMPPPQTESSSFPSRTTVLIVLELVAMGGFIGATFGRKLLR